MPMENRYTLERHFTLAHYVRLGDAQAATLVRTVAAFPVNVLVSYRGKEANARSIFALIELGVPVGGSFMVQVEGTSERQTQHCMDAIAALIVQDFEEA